MLHKAQEGVKGGTLAGGSPFAGGPRRPQPVRTSITSVVNARRAGGWNPAPTRGLEERGKAGGGRREGSSRTPTPTGPCGTGRVPRDLLRDHHTFGQGLAKRCDAGGDRDSGTSGTPSPTGRARVFTLAGMSCTVLVYGVAKGRGPIPARTSVYHAPHIEIKKRPSGAFSPFPRRGAPKLQSSAERTPQRPSGTSHASGRGGWVPKPHGGATTPSAFLWGSTPFLWARPKKWGGTGRLR